MPKPPEALRRIAFLLERTQAPTYRVQAFRKASAALDEAGPQEVARLAKLGKLKDLPGIGATTERIVIEVLAGQTPACLAKLETTEFEPFANGGEELRALLKGDCYTHPDWSDGDSPILEMAQAGKALGHDYIVIEALVRPPPLLRLCRPGRRRQTQRHDARRRSPVGHRWCPASLTGLRVDQPKRPPVPVLFPSRDPHCEVVAALARQLA